MFLNLIYFCYFYYQIFCCVPKVRESAGVTRKSIDEFQAVENAPLVIPPDFNLISPDKIEEKDIDKAEKELAEQILFGLDSDNQIIKNLQRC